ncbi:synapsin-1-like [Motacilla alba alba]|uniref:synapsin-1-like n=1 Tax=Motacilla alba alba TaxID=1094192 RepID=UPI0018D53805|nr:synapsin-1-like [Motacilla alba alba]
MGACASFGCGTRRGDCGAVCPGVLMQCPGAHTQVPASLPHFLKTAAARAGIRGAAGRAAGPCCRSPGAPLQSLRGTARTPGPTGPRRAGGRLRALSRPSPPPQRRALGPVLLHLTDGAVRRRGGRERLPRSGPGPGGGRRVRVRAPPGPALGSAASRQQRTPRAARLQSAGERLVFPLLFFPPALTETM